jgi:hypothetical protein
MRWAIVMRTLLVSLAAVLCLCLANSAQAERRMFIIANDADGYGVDRCLASGDKCGASAANAYCKTHEFAEASSYRKVDRDDITGAIPSGGSGGCHDAKCDDFVAIVCTR